VAVGLAVAVTAALAVVGLEAAVAAGLAAVAVGPEAGVLGAAKSH